MKLLNQFPGFEWFCWITAIIYLAFTDPSTNHFSICPLHLLGVTWCPGCGLGHSISYFLHGNMNASIHAHWLGIPALFIIIYRVMELSGLSFLNIFNLKINQPNSKTLNRN